MKAGVCAFPICMCVYVFRMDVRVKEKGIPLTCVFDGEI